MGNAGFIASTVARVMGPIGTPGDTWGPQTAMESTGSGGSARFGKKASGLGLPGSVGFSGVLK